MKEPKQEVAYFLGGLETFVYFIKLSERHWVEDFERYKQNLALDDDKETLLYRFNYQTDLYAPLKIDFPQYLRKSYLIMLFAKFEDFLN